MKRSGMPGRTAAKKPVARTAQKAAASRAGAAQARHTAEALDELRRDIRALAERSGRLLERLG